MRNYLQSAAPEWTLSEEEEDTEMSLRRGAAADSWESKRRSSN